MSARHTPSTITQSRKGSETQSDPPFFNRIEDESRESDGTGSIRKTLDLSTEYYNPESKCISNGLEKKTTFRDMLKKTAKGFRNGLSSRKISKAQKTEDEQATELRNAALRGHLNCAGDRKENEAIALLTAVRRSALNHTVPKKKSKKSCNSSKTTITASQK